MLTEQETKEIFARHRCCVIIPTYNNAATLASVIEGCLRHCKDVLVINDGSTDHTAAVMQQFPSVTALTQQVNQGKGTALRRAFLAAENSGYLHAVTIDSDGQHDPGDLPVFAEALHRQPGAIYIGARNMGQSAIPGKSKFGHKNSNFWFWVETGTPAEDTQSGYRLYPLAPVNKIKLFTWRYEFEIEVIVRAAWRDVPVKFIPVRVYYPEDRISHFRPFRDFMRVTLLNVWLVLAALLWFRPALIFRRLKKKSFRELWRDHVIRPGESPARKATAVAAGIFIGIIPIWGFQTASAIGVSILFRLNKPLTLLASNISIPPMIPLVVYLSLGFGGLITGDYFRIEIPEKITMDFIYKDLFRYVAGSFMLATAAAAVAWLVTYALAARLQKKRMV